MNSSSIHSDIQIALVGPMGSGKTTIGRQLASSLGIAFLDCDHALEERLGVRVSLVFDIEGEQGFRQREHDMLSDLCQEKNIVLATGGGSILMPENRELLRRFGTVIYLRTNVEQQLRRLKRDKSRPLLQRPDRREHLHKLAEQRNALYEEVADLIIESEDQTVAVMAKRVLQCWRDYCQTPVSQQGGRSALIYPASHKVTA